MSAGNTRWEYDAANRIAKCITEEMTENGLRTHMKFYNDVPGIPDDFIEGTTTEAGFAHGTHVDGDGNVHVDEVNDAYDDSRYSLSPKVKSESDFTFFDNLLADPDFNQPQPDHEGQGATWGSSSTASSGPMGINHWTRQAPVVPNPFAGLPGSDMETEIVSTDDRAQHMDTFERPKSLSHYSGPTLEPDSMGHAGPESAYYCYQVAGTRKFDTVDPAVNRRAQAQTRIQRCDAAARNLGLKRIVPERSSAGEGARFVSPSPSGQIPPPSMYIRDDSPIPSRDGDGEAAGSRSPVVPDPQFDFARWKWRSNLHKELVSHGYGSFDSTEALVTIDETEEPEQLDGSTLGLYQAIALREIFGRENSPLTELGDDEIVVDVDDPRDDTDVNVHLYEIFGRPDSPLTDISDSDEEIGERMAAAAAEEGTRTRTFPFNDASSRKSSTPRSRRTRTTQKSSAPTSSQSIQTKRITTRSSAKQLRGNQKN